MSHLHQTAGEAELAMGARHRERRDVTMWVRVRCLIFLHFTLRGGGGRVFGGAGAGGGLSVRGGEAEEVKRRERPRGDRDPR